MRLASCVSLNAKEISMASRSKRGGKFEVFQSGSSGDLGFWTGIQHADMTEVFRRVNGAWKLAHRHADMTQPKGELR